MRSITSLARIDYDAIERICRMGLSKVNHQFALPGKTQDGTSSDLGPTWHGSTSSSSTSGHTLISLSTIRLQ
ncbi:unnamed protein product [Protopolystoma xenopodis]|uniref:Uncharacterized protein n=1 Tax=Protopolystoma xenopodis TaxID=117903 RepID=A0A3S5AL26_9PLAT|nr:unnamed protein product [Protopolystoma xenopodis]